jgi:hypothetical protein
VAATKHGSARLHLNCLIEQEKEAKSLELALSKLKFEELEKQKAWESHTQQYAHPHTRCSSFVDLMQRAIESLQAKWRSNMWRRLCRHCVWCAVSACTWAFSPNQSSLKLVCARALLHRSCGSRGAGVSRIRVRTTQSGDGSATKRCGHEHNTGHFEAHESVAHSPGKHPKAHWCVSASDSQSLLRL